MIDPKTESFNTRLQSYYQRHAPFYDATRWSFLFGRRSLIYSLPALPSNPRILEVGCGTGWNIKQLEMQYPDAYIIGVDLSAAMLKKARKRLTNSQNVRVLNHHYGSDALESQSFDLILFSYSLTMMGEQIENILQHTMHDLKKNGRIAIVDFHSSPFALFEKWMQKNYVQINGSVLRLSNKYYNPEFCSIQKAYGGLWSYVQFIGKR